MSLSVPVAPVQRDPREELLTKMMIGNTLMLLELQFERGRKPKAAKLCQLLAEDFMLNFDRYMDEVNGVKSVGAKPDDMAANLARMKEAMALL